jgi:Ca2+/Na+ antiporter
MNEMPHELALGDVYLSPLLPVFTVALLGAWITTILLNKLRLSRYIMFPSTTFLTLMMLYTLLMNAFWIRI